MINDAKIVDRLTGNPFHPVPVSEYPRLFDFRITENGAVYFGRLRKEWLEGDLSERELRMLGLLHLAYATGIRSAKECKNWQSYLFLTGINADLDDSVKSELVEMGCVEENIDYDPKLYKSHLLWMRDPT